MSFKFKREYSENGLGLKFPEARLKVKASFDEAVSEFSDRTTFTDCCLANRDLLLAIAGPQVFSIVLYLICLIFNPDPVIIGGNVIAVVVLILSSLFNVLIYYNYKKTETNEVVEQLKEVLAENVELSKLDQNSNKMAECPVLSQGHSQISIINTLRNGKWTKIPSLLLAEGDIIALMGGDIAPGRVYELNISNLSDGEGGTVETVKRASQIIPSGEKILLRNKKKPAMGRRKTEANMHVNPEELSGGTPMDGCETIHPGGRIRNHDPAKKADRHRSLQSDNVEILRLTGDIRCFVMAETPIASFVRGVITKPESEKPCDSSFVRKLFVEAWSQSVYFFGALMALLIITGIVRMCVLDCKYPVLTHSLLIPMANLVMIFAPVSMPLLLVVGEALAMADILSSTEVLLYKDSDENRLKAQQLAALQTSLTSGKSAAGGASGNTPKHSVQHKVANPYEEAAHSDNDEFRDEELDERAEDIAEEVNTKVKYSRYFAYITRVLWRRLPLWGGRGPLAALSKSAIDQPEFLSIPFIRARLVENLGAISMVCFVDDDIVCENFSVTEEVFLLTDTMMDTTSGKKNHILDLTIPNEGNKTSLLECKGTVLDLHANPQATGSRFESPYWWRHMPSLKPIGMNASLTYSMNSTALSSQFNKEYELDTVKAASHQTRDVEKALVGHIRKTLPLESLRELAEEIGCNSADLERFNCEIEVNVLAPGLENAHLLEDTHTWGQEESRRRGSLIPQVRGSVFKDLRDDSYQLMTIGDPSLILNYCREYWDGTGIDALNNHDRKEVLNVYDRWRLEDFDVVAFGYSPIPEVAFPSIHDLATYHENKRQNTDNSDTASATGGAKSFSDHNSDNHCTLFFVDPSTPEQLTGFARTAKGRIEKMRLEKLRLEASNKTVDNSEFKSAYIRARSEDIGKKKKHRRSISDPSLTTTHDQLEEIAAQVLADHPMDTQQLVITEEEEGTPIPAAMPTPDINPLLSRSRGDSNASAAADTGGKPLVKSTSLDAALDALAEDAEASAAAAEEAAQAEAEALEQIAYEAMRVEVAEELVAVGESSDQLDALPMTVSVGSDRYNSNFLTAKQNRRSNMRQMWSLLRQQVFLGMTASSVPVRPDVPNTMEDLSAAGVRFVYFSPRNMKRSKPVAEKIGLAFDWNCAISLRDLDEEQKHDPHRHISTYADWDVHARMPHGVEAIKRHLKEVDNVPLLVSLYTDATPVTTEKMVEVFREYGETVLTIGSGYKAHNYSIYDMSDVATSVYTLPSLGSHLSNSENVVVDMFPVCSESSLSRADVLLSFRLIGLGTTNLLQTPYNPPRKGADGLSIHDSTTYSSQLHLPTLLESIHKGRSILLNCIQSIGFLVMALFSMGLWVLLCNVLPLSTPPTIPACIAVLFVFFYYPSITLLILQAAAPAGIMKHTPRKRNLVLRPRDKSRFLKYLCIRAGYVALSVFLVGWFATASVTRRNAHVYTRFHDIPCGKADSAGVMLIQDLMSSQALLSILGQALTLLERGQSLTKFIERLYVNPEFCIGCVLLMGIHIIAMSMRNAVRMAESEVYRYVDIDYIVWILMAVLPVIGVLVGSVANWFDKMSYRRYLQFLRLEFDTRLGMHSPR